MRPIICVRSVLAVLLLAIGVRAEAQQPAAVSQSQNQPAQTPSAPKPEPSQNPVSRFFGGEWYVSWGYSAQQWAPMDVHVVQSSLGSDFIVESLRGHDADGLGTNPFTKDLTGPEYGIRIGRFMDSRRSLAIEVSLDHTKYSSTINQTAHVTGTINGLPVNADMVLDPQTFSYTLHNGANHFMVNLVKRVQLTGTPRHGFGLQLLGKAGGGIMLPHADNTIFGRTLDLGPKKWGNLLGKDTGWWQFDGWTVGAEGGLRVIVWHPIYVDVTDKFAYSRMSGIPVVDGTMSHNLWLNEFHLAFGVMFGGNR